MSLADQLTTDLKDAMRSRDAVRLRTIRSLRAALQDQEIAQRQGGEASLSDADVLAVVQKQAKQRRDAIEQYEEADREDLAAKERDELAIIETYLPEQMSEEDIREVVAGIAERTGATSMADMGKVMGAAMQQLRGKADGRLVQQAARDVLGGS